MTLDEFIIEAKSITDLLDESVYPGNLGLMEIMKFYNVANAEQKLEMNRIIEEKDWDTFKEIIFNVLNIKLI